MCCIKHRVSSLQAASSQLRWVKGRDQSKQQHQPFLGAVQLSGDLQRGVAGWCWPSRLRGKTCRNRWCFWNLVKYIIRTLRRVNTYCYFIMIEIVDMDMQLVLVTVLFIVQVPAESYKSADVHSTECFSSLANQDRELLNTFNLRSVSSSHRCPLVLKSISFRSSMTCWCHEDWGPQGTERRWIPEMLDISMLV